MTGQIALSCTLASCGNASLRGRGFDDAVMQRALLYVGELRFWFKREAAAATIVAGTSPAQWFETLRRDGVTRLSLLHARAETTPEMRPVLAAFAGGGGSWTLATDAPSESAWWVSTWQRTGRGAASRGVVTYYGLPHALVAVDTDDIGTVTERFAAALRDANAFAAAHEGLGHWCEWFGRALAALDSDAPETVIAPPSGPVLAPAVHPLGARRLVAAAQCSWVFGGMMWWNDWSSSEASVQTRYREISATLYASVVDAIVCGVNTLSE